MNTEKESEKPVAEAPKGETPAAGGPKKKSIAWRIVKGLLWFLGGLLVFVLVAVLTLPLWINPVATSLANALVPKYTDTAFNLERVNLNPYTGKLLISGVKLANPEGFAEKDAFSLGSLSAEVEVTSLLSKTIHVREVTVDALFASWVFDAAGSNNFDRIIATVNEKLGPKKEKDEEPSETKVVIDKVTVKNVRAVVGKGVFELQSLTLTDFGKDTPAKLEISGVRLTNPTGFEAENAFSLGSLSIGMDTGDLGKPPFKIHDLVIDSPYASYVFDAQNMDNFTRMLEPLLAKGGEAEAKPAEQKAPKKEKEQAEPSASPVTLDRLEVKNLKAQICKGRFELASLVVTDFGKPTAATVRLEGAKLVNPDGFKQPNAFSLGLLSVGLETADFSKKPMALHDITLKSLYAGYVFNGNGESNIDVLFKPLMGGGKKGGETKDVPADDKSEGEAGDGKGGAPVVVDKIVLEDVRADVGAGQFELQSLSLADFGKDTPMKLVISGVKLTNPPGFAATNAFSLGSFSVSLETADLSKKPMVFQDIMIDSPYASYVFDKDNVDNFTRMLEPLLAKGGEAKKETKEKKETKPADEKPAASAGAPVIVGRLEVKNLKSHVCNGQFELASLVVTDFGNSTNTQVRLEGVKLENPDGFSGPDAFSLKSLSVGLETDDLSKKPMVFHDIILDSPYAGVFINGDWELNFKALFRPLMGDEKKDGEKKSEGDEKKVAAEEKKDEEKKDEEDDSRVVIDKLEIAGTKIQFDSPIPVLKGTLPIPLPTFKDIGKDSKEGATVKDVGEKVLAEAKAIVGPVGGILDKVMRNPSGNMKELLDIDAVKMLGDAKAFLAAGTTNVLGNAKGFVSAGATNMLSGAKGFVSGGATNVLSGAKDFVSGGATNVLGGAKGKLGNAVGSTKEFIGGFLPGGDKKDDGGKDGAKGKGDKKKEDDEPAVQDKAPEESKGLLNKVNPMNLLK